MSSRLPNKIIDQANSWPTRSWTGPNSPQRSIVLKERARHVHYTTIAGRPHLVWSQLVGTKSSWHGHATVVIAALQVLETWLRYRKSWPGQYDHADHQSNGDTCLVPNYPCWILGKNTPSLDKWTLFPGININALNPTRAKSSLDPRKHIFIYLLCIHSIILLFIATHNIYSQPLLCHYWL